MYPLSKRKTVLPFLQPIRSGGSVINEAAALRKAKHNPCMRHLAYMFCERELKFSSRITCT